VLADDLCTKTLAEERKHRANQRGSAGPQSKGTGEETESLFRPAAMRVRGGMESSHPDRVRRRHRALLEDLPHVHFAWGIPCPDG